VPETDVQVTSEAEPQKSSLYATWFPPQASRTLILVSKDDPHKDAVISSPFPVIVYHTSLLVLEASSTVA
jgi:hypothetical protein